MVTNMFDRTEGQCTQLHPGVVASEKLTKITGHCGSAKAEINLVSRAMCHCISNT